MMPAEEKGKKLKEGQDRVPTTPVCWAVIAGAVVEIISLLELDLWRRLSDCKIAAARKL
jgi:hypothetical protein